MANHRVVQYDEKAQRMVDEMIRAEARALARRRAEACDCKDGMFPGAALTDRRRLLFAAGSIVGATSVPALAMAAEKAPPGAVYYDVPADPIEPNNTVVARTYSAKRTFAQIV